LKNTILNIIKLGRLIIHSVVLVYLLGALFALVLGAPFDLYKIVFVYLIILTGTFSAVYNNNYNDVNVDKYATQTFFSGGSRILVDHPELMRPVKLLSLFFLLFSIVLGGIGIVLFSFPITFFFFVVIGNLLGWYYTAPPIKLLYRGLGELGTMLAAGFFVPGLGYFALINQVDLRFVIFSIPLLFYGLSISFYLEIPDRDADTKGGKKTFVVRHGLYAGFFVGALCSICASLSYMVFSIFEFSSGMIQYWVIFLFSLIPLFSCLYSVVKQKKENVNSLAFASSSSFFIFYILVIIYFIYLLFF
jgi:1,4-dihydroxy-2-naphthoate octaprenyltransferase